MESWQLNESRNDLQQHCVSLDLNSVELATGNTVPSEAAAKFQGNFIPQPLTVSSQIP